MLSHAAIEARQCEQGSRWVFLYFCVLAGRDRPVLARLHGRHDWHLAPANTSGTG